MPEPVIAAQGVSVRFGGLVAVDAVDFAVHAGELVGIIGPNGAGKTTFFHTLSGVLAPTAGRVIVAGDDLTGKAPHVFSSHGVARTFQTPRVFKELPALDNVRFGLEFAGRTRQHAHDAFDDAGQILEFLAWPTRPGCPRAGSRRRASGSWRSAWRSARVRACCCSTKWPRASRMLKWTPRRSSSGACATSSASPSSGSSTRCAC
jgi:ABC-type lipopolysaccharide export system ATPase subunit